MDSYTADWTIPNTNEYYLDHTDFINNNVGVYDRTKGTAQPGEGAQYCSFNGGRFGILSDATDYFPGNESNYDNATFSNNTFSGLQYGFYGNLMNNAHISQSSFTDCYLSAITIGISDTYYSEIANNTIIVPGSWPASLRAQYPSEVV